MRVYVKVAKKKEPVSAGDAIVPAAIGSMGTRALGAAALNASAKSMMGPKNTEPAMSGEQLDKMRKAMKAKKVPISDISDRARSAMGAAAFPPHVARNATEGSGLSRGLAEGVTAAISGGVPDPKNAKRRGYVAVSGGAKGDPHLIAHEFGHVGGKKSRVGFRNPTYAKVVPLTRMLSSPAGAVAGYVASKTRKSDGGATKETAIGGAVGAGAGVAVATPLLAEEARASIRGYKGVSAAGLGKGSKARYVKRMGRAWGSYVAAASVIGASSGMLGSGVGRYRRENPSKPVPKKAS